MADIDLSRYKLRASLAHLVYGLVPASREAVLRRGIALGKIGRATYRAPLAPFHLARLELSDGTALIDYGYRELSRLAIGIHRDRLRGLIVRSNTLYTVTDPRFVPLCWGVVFRQTGYGGPANLVVTDDWAYPPGNEEMSRMFRIGDLSQEYSVVVAFCGREVYFGVTKRELKPFLISVIGSRDGNSRVRRWIDRSWPAGAFVAARFYADSQEPVCLPRVAATRRRDEMEQLARDAGLIIVNRFAPRTPAPAADGHWGTDRIAEALGCGRTREDAVLMPFGDRTGD